MSNIVQIVLCLVDANILLRRVDAAHPHHQIAVAALKSLAMAGTELYFVPQCLYEFWAVATRPLADNGLALSPALAAIEIRRLKAGFLLLHDTPSLLQEWERVVTTHGVQGKQSHDARLVAAMKTHRLTHLLTFNARHFRRYENGENIALIEPQNI